MKTVLILSILISALLTNLFLEDLLKLNPFKLFYKKYSELRTIYLSVLIFMWLIVYPTILIMYLLLFKNL